MQTTVITPRHIIIHFPLPRYRLIVASDILLLLSSDDLLRCILGEVYYHSIAEVVKYRRCRSRHYRLSFELVASLEPLILVVRSPFDVDMDCAC